MGDEYTRPQKETAQERRTDTIELIDTKRFHVEVVWYDCCDFGTILWHDKLLVSLVVARYCFCGTMAFCGSASYSMTGTGANGALFV